MNNFNYLYINKIETDLHPYYFGGIYTVSTYGFISFSHFLRRPDPLMQSFFPMLVIWFSTVFRLT